jgi:site-specific recombinase XerD
MPRHSTPITEVTARGKTRWRVVVSITKDGKRSRVSRTVDTREEAEKLHAQATLGEVVPSSKDTFNDWADQWMARKEDSGLRPVTLAGYRSDLTHPRDAFGKVKIQDVTEEHVERLVRSMRDAGASRRTTGKMLTTLRSVFRLAVRKNVLRFNPAEDVEALGKPKGERDALTVKELEAIRAAINGDAYEACWMLTLAGLRRSELLALTWADVNLSTGELTISKGRGLIGGVQGPKTAKGHRVLPLDTERVALLRELRARQAEVYGLAHVRDGWILVNEFGRPMRPEDWSRRWKALCKKTEGVADTHVLHAARHSTVTFMRNAGVPDHVVAAWHGHDEVVMRQTYSHAHTEQLKSAGAALSFGS